jgi:acetyl esterase/lipase
MIVDVLKTIAWVKAHAHEYGGDPSRIAITGESAGGHLAALAALAHDDPTLKPGFEGADCSVAMALPIYGRYDFAERLDTFGKNKKAVLAMMSKSVMPGPPERYPALWTAMSPLDRVRADAPPMLIANGTGDTLIPYEDARSFVAALRGASSATVRHVELPGIQHMFDFASSALVWAHVRAVEAFLAPLANPEAAGRQTGFARGEPALAGAA